MLYSMSHPWHVILIREIAHIDIDGGAGLIGIRIVD